MGDERWWWWGYQADRVIIATVVGLVGENLRLMLGGYREDWGIDRLWDEEQARKVIESSRVSERLESSHGNETV